MKEPEKNIARKTILFGLLPPYADWECAYIASALNMLCPGRYDIRTVAPSRAPAASIGGFSVLPDFDPQTAPSNFQALVLVGGMSWRTESAQSFAPLVRSCRDQGALLCGICDAAGYLGTLGLLNGIRHTANDPEDLKRWAGAAYSGEKNYLRQQAVCDGGIVTANGTAALEFAREILLALDAAPEQKILEWYNFHKLGYYEAAMPQGI